MNWPPRQQNIVECRSLAACHLPDASCDYVFTDPPFGGNLAYSELNLLCESWLGLQTRRSEEAIENRQHGKSIDHYRELLTACFRQYYRVLKPGRTMTVLFHHTQPAVWQALQSALWEAGFRIDHIGSLDKRLGTFKQVNLAGSVKQDLLIDLVKPIRPDPDRRPLEPGTCDEVWSFVTRRLAELGRRSDRTAPDEAVPEEAVPETEREPVRLFGRVVAHLLQSGKTVPLSAGDFYDGLSQRYSVIDGRIELPPHRATAAPIRGNP